MSQSQATDCINQIDIAQTKIAKYNTDWNIWDIEYKRLEQEIATKETEINNKKTITEKYHHGKFFFGI